MIALLLATAQPIVIVKRPRPEKASRTVQCTEPYADWIEGRTIRVSATAYKHGRIPHYQVVTGHFDFYCDAPSRAAFNALSEAERQEIRDSYAREATQRNADDAAFYRAYALAVEQSK